jgi:hypothetical protein
MRFSARSRFPRSSVAQNPSPGEYNTKSAELYAETGHWNIRQRNTTPMQGMDANLSLNGMDALNFEPRPGPGSYELAKSFLGRKPHETEGATLSFVFGTNSNKAHWGTRLMVPVKEEDPRKPRPPVRKRKSRPSPKTKAWEKKSNSPILQRAIHSTTGKDKGQTLNWNEWCENLRTQERTDSSAQILQDSHPKHSPRQPGQRRRRHHEVQPQATLFKIQAAAKRRRETARQQNISEVAALSRFRSNSAVRPNRPAKAIPKAMRAWDAEWT